MSGCETPGVRHVWVMREVADTLERTGCPREVDITWSPEVVGVLRAAADESEVLMLVNGGEGLHEEAPPAVWSAVKLAYRLLGTTPGRGVYA